MPGTAAMRARCASAASARYCAWSFAVEAPSTTCAAVQVPTMLPPRRTLPAEKLPVVWVSTRCVGVTAITRPATVPTLLVTTSPTATVVYSATASIAYAASEGLSPPSKRSYPVMRR